MWKLRYWEPGKSRPTIVEVYDDRGIGADLQYQIDNLGCTRVEAVRKGHPADPPKPVKAKTIEWVEQEHSKGEFWVGRIGDRIVADVFGHKDGTKPHYSLCLGDSDEQYIECSSIDSGKRSAQRALNKAVQTLAAG